MSNISGFIKRLRDIMRNDAGINGDAQRIEQIAWLLFLKVYDTKEQDWEFEDDKYQSIMAGINCPSVRLFTFFKGPFVAFAAFFAQVLVFSQHTAKGREFFGIIAQFVFCAVIDADFDARQIVEVVQKFLHLLQVIYFHSRKLRYEITILRYK